MPELRRESWIAKGLFESALIVFSVLLALSVDNCRDHAARQRDLSEARSSLTQEIRANRAILAQKDILPYHESMLGLYREQGGLETPTRADAILDTGVHVAPLRDAAWRSFVGSAISAELPFRQRMVLADVYGDQEDLRQLHAATIAAMMAPSADRDKPAFVRDTVRSIGLYLSDVVASEQRLIAAYDRALTELSGAPAPSAR